ncbi:MAG: hypothetical protein HYU99_00590 [Deltaproteobacteria bacterium]|nr:hypothetical protein [Deltaproteobacteria bacterium]
MKKGIIFVFVLSLVLGAPFENASAKTYWATGGGVGAGVIGAGAGITAGLLCRFAEENSSTCRAVMIPVGIVGGGAVGFGIGALIGSAFKKKAPVVQAIVDPATGTYGASVGMSF